MSSNQDWMNNPALKNIDPEKLKMLMSMTEQSSGKNQNELLPFLMAAASQSKEKGVAFSQEETDAIIEVMKAGKSPEEVARIEKIRNMMKMMKR